jgi:heme/copper-type cytochrome/quinol oxidase subunit 1
MADERYNRWQGLAIAQLTVAVALVSGLSVSGLAVGFSLLQNKEFAPCGISLVMFIGSFPLLLIAALLSFVAVISRTLDFRLTARKVRKDQNPDYSRPLKIFRLGKDEYGRITWLSFWLGCAAFLLGVISLFIAIGATYVNRLS